MTESEAAYTPSQTTPQEATMSTTAPERTSDLAAVEGDIAAIFQGLDHMRRVVEDKSMRASNAAVAGATFAYQVERFLSDPEGVGTDALRAAYDTFMGRHSGNFTDSVMAASRG